MGRSLAGEYMGKVSAVASVDRRSDNQPAVHQSVPTNADDVNWRPPPCSKSRAWNMYFFFPSTVYLQSVDGLADREERAAFLDISISWQRGAATMKDF